MATVTEQRRASEIRSPRLIEARRVIEKFVGGALQVGGGSRHLREVHQVEGVEVAEQAERESARRAGMGGEGETDFSRFQQRGVLGEVLDVLGEEVGAFQEG